MKHTVIIPAYNAANYIVQSIGSVLSQLGDVDEIIVIDDGSTDETVDLIASISDDRVELVSQPINCGVASARNRGLAAATGDYVHFLDHDDLWSTNRLKIVISIIRKEEPDIITGFVEHFFCEHLSQDQRARYLLPPQQAAALPGSVVMHRKLVDKIGEFDELLSSGEFIDYLSRAITFNPTWSKTDRILFLRRIHGRNHTLSDTKLDASYIEVIRRHLARHNATF